MASKDELLKAIGTWSEADATRDKAKAALAIMLVDEASVELRECTDNVCGEVDGLAKQVKDGVQIIPMSMASLAQEISEHREELRRAAESAAAGGQEIATLTRALVRITGYYVWLTGGLLIVAALALGFQIVQWASAR